MHRHIGFVAAATLLATLSTTACKGRGGHNAYDTANAGSASGNLPGAAASPNAAPGAAAGAIPATTVNPNSAAPNAAAPSNGMTPGGAASDTNQRKSDTGHKKKHAAKRR
jgi:predicted carbohydrate-binding protein with CBM5 and CBM33 domain